MDATDPRSDRWSADVVLADGSTTHVRPIVPEDADAIMAFHERQSRESIYFRFFSPRPRLSEADVRHLTTVDGTSRMAFVADRDGELIGIARYDRYATQSLAEVAFFTDDEHHGRGIATLLLEYLAAYAREVGISRFEAHVLPSNRRMVRVFTQAGFEASSEFADGVIEVTLEIQPTESAIEAIAERARAAERQAVVRLLEPRSIAVVGASRDRGSIGHRVLRNLLAEPFAGAVYPVHPEARAIAGVRAYPTVQDIPDDVDLAVICVPAADVVAVIEDCGRARVDVAAVITAGFAETGPAGQAEQDLVLATARRFGMRILGPNCLGVINNDPRVAMHATFAEVTSRPGRVGLLSQSGTLGAVILDRAREKGVGFSTFVAVGNKSDLSGNDLLQYWLDDDLTDVVLLYLESFGNPRRFSRNVRAVALRKPVFAVRSGAVLISSEHAGTVGIDDATVDALLRQTGVVRVPTIRALLDAALVASHQPIPAGAGVVVVGNSGGSASMAADACVDAGLTLTDLSPATREAIDGHRLHGRSLANPVDLRYDAASEQYEPVLDAVMVDADVDVVLFVHAPYGPGDEARVSAMLDRAAANHPDVTLVACIYGPHPAVTPGGVPVFDFPDEAAHAVGSVVRHRLWLDAQRAGEMLSVRDPEAVLGAARALLGGDRHRELNAHEARQLLDLAGVASVPVHVIGDEDALASRVADGFAFDGAPHIAVKAEHHDSGATTVQGGVALDLRDGNDVMAAARSIVEHLGDAAWPLLIQPMVTSGYDVQIAIETHPVVGPVVRLGPGGGAARFGSAPQRVLPISDVGVRELVVESGLADLLDAESIEHVVALVRRIAALADAAPEVANLVCNPVIARPDGADVVEVSVTLEAVQPDQRPPVRRVDQTR